MAKERIEIGPGPAEEECAQVGTTDYEERAMRECRAFISAIRMTLGEEPDGAQLRLARTFHDLGSYLEVVCDYDPDKQAAVEYAFRCEKDAPTEWAQAGLKAPVTPKGRGR